MATHEVPHFALTFFFLSLLRVGGGTLATILALLMHNITLIYSLIRLV